MHYFDWEDLPHFDYDNVEVRQWMAEVLTYWVRELAARSFLSFLHPMLGQWSTG